ncbi:F-box/kelch-repeat protein At3g23880-like [Silene latifolia]|uniref:F-box/kelch-repeat protein At3g23880-like n=1 Tax=Silene latifolia TaxID=37657 RepID=UPI003D77D404
MRGKVVIKQQGYLFDDLIFQEILTRLPVTSIIRFKSVSKQWYSTLSSSDFAKAHLIKSPYSHPSAPVNTLFIQCSNNRYLFTYNDDDDDHISDYTDNLLKLDADFWDEKKNELFFTGCCNGLICLTPVHKKYFIIWNPATRKMHKYASDGYLLRAHVVCGFGYVSSVDDYKYVRVSIVHVGWQKSNYIVHVFSLKENKGRKINFDFDPDADITLYDPPVLINETLYWRAHHSQYNLVIVSFDLGVETFDIIKGWTYLGVMGGCLSKCGDCNGSNIGDMTMRIFESTGTVKSIDLPKGLISTGDSQTIGFTRTGKFFVTGPFEGEIWHVVRKTLGIVDTSSKPAQYKRLLKFDERINIARYVPSLVSPFPTEELSRLS